MCCQEPYVHCGLAPFYGNHLFVAVFFQFKFEIVKSAVLNWLAVEIDWLGWLVQHQLQPAHSGLPNRP